VLLPYLMAAVRRPSLRAPGHVRTSRGVAATGPRAATPGKAYCEETIEDRTSYACTGKDTAGHQLFWCPCVDHAHRGKYACCPKITTGPGKTTHFHCDCSDRKNRCNDVAPRA
jgi:hypothetical protein